MFTITEWQLKCYGKHALFMTVKMDRIKFNKQRFSLTRLYHSSKISHLNEWNSYLLTIKLIKRICAIHLIGRALWVGQAITVNKQRHFLRQTIRRARMTCKQDLIKNPNLIGCWEDKQQLLEFTKQCIHRECTPRT